MKEDIGDDRIELENKHRKEKKELQAQIQALKKAAKNDKTKKKELVAEITRLECEQKERHEKEIETLDRVSFEEDDMSENVEQETFKNSAKVSKAQKRRAKKEQQEKVREIEIKLQEKENLLGPRNTELKAIRAKLEEKRMQIHPIPSDGDCLYNAVAHQLLQSRKQSISVDELRANVATYIRNNKSEYFPFLSNPDTFEMLTEAEFEEYCDKIATTKTWGGQLEIRALSNYLKCPISVIQATGPDSIEQGEEHEGPPLIITYHRHMYSLGEHFNSTQKLKYEEA